MPTDLVAHASTAVDAPINKVWDALVDPVQIKQYMFGADVASEWEKGSPITWRGEWQGKAYEDKGVILAIDPPRRLQYSHYSPMSGQPDVSDSYHTVTLELTERYGGTLVSLSQDNNLTEEARGHSEKNWQGMLEGLKTLLEE